MATVGSWNGWYVVLTKEARVIREKGLVDGFGVKF